MISVEEYLHSKASRNKIPLSGTFELSPVCNFACRMCYVRKTPEQIREEGKRLRSWQEWLELGERCRDAGLLYLLLTGGEPFLYPGFRELYTALHKLGFVLAINTNGTLVDEDTVAWLKEYAPQRVNITLYGASRETYGRVCGNPSGYDKAVRAIKMLKDAGIPVVINASMIPENAEDLEKIILFGKELGLNTRVATYMFPPARREREQGDSRFTPEQSAGIYMRKARCMMDDAAYVDFLKKNTQEQQESGDDWGDHREEFMRCRAGRCSFWVAWDGSMTACGVMEFPGKEYPFERPFEECWLELTDRVRSAAVLKECAGCARREACKPCAGMLYTETGDVNKKAPYMCQLAEQIEALIEQEAAKYVEE